MRFRSIIKRRKLNWNIHPRLFPMIKKMLMSVFWIVNGQWAYDIIYRERKKNGKKDIKRMKTKEEHEQKKNH